MQVGEAVRETWRLRATIDLRCAACDGTAAELEMSFPVELGLAAEAGDFKVSMRPVESEDNLPVVVKCLSCKQTVRFGESARVIT